MNDDGEFRDVHGWPGYQVNRSGVVRTFKNSGMKKSLVPRQVPVIKKPHYDKGGYACVSFQEIRNGRRMTMRVHKLVLITFVGPKPEDLVACHNDGNKLNNHVSNLRWDTQRSNIYDRMKHGTHYRGEQVGTSKLTASCVLDIRARVARGESRKSIAKDYGIAPGSISFIVNRVSWKHI